MVDEAVFSDVLLDATKEVFETMIFMEVEQSSEPVHRIEGDALLGSITFQGGIEGCLGICCDEACARTIAANMLGLDSEDEISKEDFADAIGEVANMVMGSVKTRLHGDVGDVAVSIPTVVSGRQIESSLADGAKRVPVEVSIEGDYTAEICLLWREASESK
jgi:chemotaxis protein CheX